MTNKITVKDLMNQRDALVEQLDELDDAIELAELIEDIERRMKNGDEISIDEIDVDAAVERGVESLADVVERPKFSPFPPFDNIPKTGHGVAPTIVDGNTDPYKSKRRVGSGKPWNGNGKKRGAGATTSRMQFAPNLKSAILSVVKKGETVTTPVVAKRLEARHLVDPSKYSSRASYMGTLFSKMFSSGEFEKLPWNGQRYRGQKVTQWRRMS